MTLGALSLARIGSGQAGSDSATVRPITPGKVVPCLYSVKAMIFSITFDKMVDSFIEDAATETRSTQHLVDIQDGALVLIPQPQDYVAHMAGLHKEVWADVNTTTYLAEERGAWNDSERD